MLRSASEKGIMRKMAIWSLVVLVLLGGLLLTANGVSAELPSPTPAADSSGEAKSVLLSPQLQGAPGSWLLGRAPRSSAAVAGLPAQKPAERAGQEVLYAEADSVVVENFGAYNYGDWPLIRVGYDGYHDPPGGIVRGLDRKSVV